MKKLITNYTFNAAAQTVTFTDYTTISLESVLLVTNVTDNVIVYNFADIGYGGSVSGNILTLAYNTTGMDDTDDLQIFYDDTDVQPSNAELQTTLNSLTGTLQELTARLAVLAGMANAGQPALRVIPIASVSTAVTGSVTATVTGATVTSLNSIGIGGTVSNAMNNVVVELANINNVTL